MGFFKTLKDMMTTEKVDYKEKISQGATAIDVRTAAEFNRGHAKGSINIPLNTLSNKLSNYAGKEVVVVCKSGMRSAQAKQIFERQGITCYNAGAWQNIS